MCESFIVNQNWHNYESARAVLVQFIRTGDSCEKNSQQILYVQGPINI